MVPESLHFQQLPRESGLLPQGVNGLPSFFSHIQLFQTAARQAPLSMGFSSQER